MKLSFIAIIAAMSLAISGCLCIQDHIDGRSTPYRATVCVCRGIAEAFVEKPEWHGGSRAEATMEHVWAAIFLPVSIICLPFEAVADTITLPYDLLKK